MILMMKKKKYLILSDEFIQFCKLNDIEDVEGHAENIFNKAFTIEKYGEMGNIKKKSEKPKPKIKPSPQPNPNNDLYDE